MRLYLIRHALTLPTVSDSHLWPLSQEGEAQASAFAEAPLWEEVSTVYSSTESKALATVRPASATHGLEIEEDERLREARRPARWIKDYEDAVRRYLEHPGNPVEEWESAPDVRARMVECIGEISTRHPEKSVAVCGHGLALTLYLSHPALVLRQCLRPLALDRFRTGRRGRRRRTDGTVPRSRRREAAWTRTGVRSYAASNEGPKTTGWSAGNQ